MSTPLIELITEVLDTLYAARDDLDVLLYADDRDDDPILDWKEVATTRKAIDDLFDNLHTVERKLGKERFDLNIQRIRDANLQGDPREW